MREPLLHQRLDRIGPHWFFKTTKKIQLLHTGKLFHHIHNARVFTADDDQAAAIANLGETAKELHTVHVRYAEITENKIHQYIAADHVGQCPHSIAVALNISNAV